MLKKKIGVLFMLSLSMTLAGEINENTTFFLKYKNRDIKIEREALELSHVFKSKLEEYEENPEMFAQLFDEQKNKFTIELDPFFKYVRWGQNVTPELVESFVKLSENRLDLKQIGIDSLLLLINIADFFVATTSSIEKFIPGTVEFSDEGKTEFIKPRIETVAF